MFVITAVKLTSYVACNALATIGLRLRQLLLLMCDKCLHILVLVPIVMQACVRSFVSEFCTSDV